MYTNNSQTKLDYKILLKRKDKPLLVKYDNVFSSEEVSYLMGLLLCKNNIDWKVYKIYDKFEQARESIAFSDSVWLKYKYSGLEIEPYLMIKHADIFNLIQKRIEPLTEHMKSKGWIAPNLENPNYWLGNLYRDGYDHISKHADDETDLVKTAPIVSISLGAERTFFVYKSNGSSAEVKIKTTSGSVIMMIPPMQEKYKHSISVEKKCTKMRINLTGRYISKGKYKFS